MGREGNILERLPALWAELTKLPVKNAKADAQAVAGVQCVSPVQAYLDLRGLPERAEEAAEHLRKERLQWGLLSPTKVVDFPVHHSSSRA